MRPGSRREGREQGGRVQSGDKLRCHRHDDTASWGLGCGSFHHLWGLAVRCVPLVSVLCEVLEASGTVLKEVLLKLACVECFALCTVLSVTKSKNENGRSRTERRSR